MKIGYQCCNRIILLLFVSPIFISTNFSVFFFSFFLSSFHLFVAIRSKPKTKQKNEMKLKVHVVVAAVTSYFCWMKFCCSPISFTSNSELFGEKRNRNRNAVMWPRCSLVRSDVCRYRVYMKRQTHTHTHTKYLRFGCVEEGKEYATRKQTSADDDDEKKVQKKINKNTQNQQQQIMNVCIFGNENDDGDDQLHSTHS